MNSKKVFGFLLVFLWVGNICILNSQPVDYRLSLFKKLIIETMHKNSIPGMQVAIVSNDSIVWKGNFGYSNLKRHIPVSDSTVFRVGSISKPFIAISVMMLQEKGLIDLNDKFSKLAPEVKFYNKWENITPVKLVHLLEHTAGFDDLRPAEYSATANNWTTLQGLQFHPSTRISRWEPGIFMSYSNMGPTCAAYVVEKYSHQPYEEFVKINIFNPLGVISSSFFPDEYINRNLAKGYNTTDSTEVEYWHVLSRPSGALNSNVTDLSKVVRLFLNRGTLNNQKLLKSSSIERIERTESTLAAKYGYKYGYGLCMKSGLYKGYTMFSHNGKLNGYISILQYYPDLNIGFIILMNTSNETGILHFLNQFQDLLIPDSIRKPDSDSTLNCQLDKDVTGWYEVATSKVELTKFTGYLNIVKIGKKNNHYYCKLLFRGYWDLIPSSKNCLISTSTKEYIPFVFVSDVRGNKYLQMPVHELNFKKVSGFIIWSKMGFLIFGIIIILSAIIDLLIILAISFLKRRKPRRLIARILQLITVLIGIIWLWLFNYHFSFYTIGKLGFESLSFFIISLLFPLASISSFVYNVLTMKYETNRIVKIHSLIVSSFCVITTVILFNWDLIGLRTWIY